VTGTRVILVDRPGSVQSAIRVGQVGIGADDPDFLRLTALSQVLGGAFNSRINQNLRERHGWTYGAFTNFNALRGTGTFMITSSVRTTPPTPRWSSRCASTARSPRSRSRRTSCAAR
jgi:zinc protease